MNYDIEYYEVTEIADHRVVMANALERAKECGVDSFYAVEYHVFTDGADDYVSTYDEAMELVRGLESSGHKSIRCYVEFYYDEECFDDAMESDQDCLYAKGHYPS